MNTKYETKRLLLRICEKAHAPIITEFYRRNYEEFAKYEPLNTSAKTVPYHKASLKYESQLFLNGTFVRFYIFEKSNPMTVIGTISYRDITHGVYDSCLVGYKMDYAYRRRGYAKEALLCGNQIMLNELGLQRIEATVLPDNIASQNLLSGIGFQREGLLRKKILLQGERKDHYLYAYVK